MSHSRVKATAAFVLEGRIITPGTEVEVKGDALKNLLYRGKVEVLEEKPKSTRTSNKKTDPVKPDANEK